MGGGSVGRGGGNTGVAIAIGIGVLGSILGSGGHGAILRGGTVGGDRCDPRGRRTGPVIDSRNGPIMRGPTYYVVTGAR